MEGFIQKKNTEPGEATGLDEHFGTTGRANTASQRPTQRGLDRLLLHPGAAEAAKQRSCGGQCVVVGHNSCYKSVKKHLLWNDHLIYNQLQLVKGCNCRPSMHVPFEMMILN